MSDLHRRQFMTEVGRGMVLAAVGAGLASDLGLSPACAAEDPKELTFGALEPLVGLMQETPADKLVPILVKRLNEGTELKQVVAAAALANARAFGGEDYVGFHTMMALSPSWHMAAELPAATRPLPVLKVIHRNARRLQERGGRKNEVLGHVEARPLSDGGLPAEQLGRQMRAGKTKEAEGTLAGIGRESADAALDALLPVVADCPEVHRIVLASRAWDLLPVVGREHALTLLRQSVHYCARENARRWEGHYAGARAVLPKLIDRYKLPRDGKGRTADDAWLEKTSLAIFKGKPDDAAEVVAAALAEGFSRDAVGEAIALAANQLVLRDNGRPQNQTSAGKPVGSVHGDSIGVHACDSANAWRNLSRVSSPRQSAACLILGAWQVAFDRGDRGGNFLTWEPYPRADARERVKTDDPAKLLQTADEAIRNKDQALASAAVAAYAATGKPERPVLDLLLRYAISEDGALHAEKYYRTTTEDFAATRPAFRWRHLVALARVTASAFGQPAPGHDAACKLLKS